MWFSKKNLELPTPEQALPGRDQAMPTPERHHVFDRAITPPYPIGADVVDFGMGCFWGAERKFWRIPGVLMTAVGYQGGHTLNPNYDEVCSGRTAHAETVRVVYDPAQAPFAALLKVFWESHDPTQGMRQGNDVGTQYRSAIYAHTDAQLAAATASRDSYQNALRAAGKGDVTTEIRLAPPFYFAEAYHQQYLSKNPNGYCGLGGTGVRCPA